MGTGLTAKDRKILWAALGIFVLLALATLWITPIQNSQNSPVPSTYSSESAGARAAFLLLQTIRGNAQRWEEPPFRLLSDPRHETLIMAEPTEQPSRMERRALEQFVSSGGRVLFCGSGLPSYFSGIQLQVLDGKPELEQYSPLVSGHDGELIELRPAAFWTQFNRSQAPVYGEGQRAVVVVSKIGEGELIWWAAATPLSNSGLTEAGNVSLLLNSVGQGRRIYWDEYFHGERGNLFTYIGRTEVRWGIVQLLLIALAAVWTWSRRSGPAIPARAASRLSPLEFVQTLGGLYKRAKSTSIPLEVNRNELRHALARRLSLSSSASDDQFAAVASERLGWDESETLHALRSGEGPALKTVQKLQQLTARLRTVQER